jgi:phenylpropionate dioxygenase-like ring-hydroxylating dioxygenase large terminal subunit
MELVEDLNHTTQPIGKLRKFNNWDFVSQGWYVACKSKELKTKTPLSKKICGHQLVLFRTEAGEAKALDAFCPHMGMNLAKEGKVMGDPRPPTTFLKSQNSQDKK